MRLQGLQVLLLLLLVLVVMVLTVGVVAVVVVVGSSLLFATWSGLLEKISSDRRLLVMVKELMLLVLILWKLPYWGIIAMRSSVSELLLPNKSQATSPLLLLLN